MLLRYWTVHFIDTCCSLTWTTASTSGNEFWVGGTGGKRQKRWWAGASDSIWRSLGEFWRVKTYQKVEELFHEKSFKVQCNVSSWLLNNPPFSEFRAIEKLGTSTILMDEKAHRPVCGCYTTRQHVFFQMKPLALICMELNFPFLYSCLSLKLPNLKYFYF